MTQPNAMYLVYAHPNSGGRARISKPQTRAGAWRLAKIMRSYGQDHLIQIKRIDADRERLVYELYRNRDGWGEGRPSDRAAQWEAEAFDVFAHAA